MSSKSLTLGNSPSLNVKGSISSKGPVTNEILYVLFPKDNPYNKPASAITPTKTATSMPITFFLLLPLFF